MASICFYFHVHQPYRLKHYNIFNIGKDRKYFDSHDHERTSNKSVFNKVAEKCYLPTNKLLLELLERHPEFRLSFSITGVFLEQAKEYNPKVLKSFQKLVDTGRVELINETYYHSLAALYSKDEFFEQVNMHKEALKKYFGYTPKVFRNTELIYNNQISEFAEEMGFSGVITEGADKILGWRSPNFIYHPAGTKKIKLLLKNYKLSDDIAFRFSNKGWEEHPLTVDKYTNWLNKINGNGNLINLFMDYETFGEHQWEDTGIFNFLDALPAKFLEHSDNDFVTPSEAIDKYDALGDVDVPDYISWADLERDLSAWRSNDMQHDALYKIYELEKQIKKTKNKELIETWRKLQTSDHFYYMCTKWFSDGDVHKYFSPYDSPYEAFISFMNVLEDLKNRVAHKLHISV